MTPEASAAPLLRVNGDSGSVVTAEATVTHNDLLAAKTACERARWPEQHRDDCEWCLFVATRARSHVLETATRAVLTHYGYTDSEVTKAEAESHGAAGCEFVGYGWECEDENGKSRHPLRDEIERTAEILRVAFEAVGVEL